MARGKGVRSSEGENDDDTNSLLDEIETDPMSHLADCRFSDLYFRLDEKRQALWQLSAVTWVEVLR